VASMAQIRQLMPELSRPYGSGNVDGMPNRLPSLK
jgi:hypothetical protein